jgi:hypothetical protein
MKGTGWYADRLPLEERHPVFGGYEAGVFSTEFEGGWHAKAIAALAALVVRKLKSEDEVDEGTKIFVRSKLAEIGLNG